MQFQIGDIKKKTAGNRGVKIQRKLTKYYFLNLSNCKKLKLKLKLLIFMISKEMFIAYYYHRASFITKNQQQ